MGGWWQRNQVREACGTSPANLRAWVGLVFLAILVLVCSWSFSRDEPRESRVVTLRSEPTPEAGTGIMPPARVRVAYDGQESQAQLSARAEAVMPGGVALRALGGAVTGVVTSHYDPVRDVSVYLCQHLERNAGEMDEIFSARKRAMFVSRNRSNTDSSGRFGFVELVAGSYDLAVVRDGVVWHQVDGISVCDGRVVCLELDLPPMGSVAGRLVGPPGSGFSGLQVAAAPGYQPQVASEPDVWHAAVLAEVDSDGYFQMPSVPSGTVLVSLVVPGREIPCASGGALLEPSTTVGLGRVVVGSRETTNLEFDICGVLPRYVDFSVIRNAEPWDGLVVTASRIDRRDAEVSRALRRGLSYGPLSPGKWAIELSCWEDAWRYFVPDNIVIGTRDPSGGSVDLAFVSGEMVIERLGGWGEGGLRPVSVHITEGGVEVASAVTSPDKSVAMSLPLGEYVLWVQDRAGDELLASDVFAWVGGPMTVKVVAAGKREKVGEGQRTRAGRKP